MTSEITFPQTEAELAETVRMTTLAFRRQVTPELMAGFWADVRRPGCRPEHQRILKVDGRIVAGALIVEKELRFGGSVFRCAGIGDVATDPDCRLRGLGRQMMEHCLEYMTDQGYAVSVLFGITDYYHKFGYRPAGCESSLTLTVPDALHAEAGALSVGPLRRDDLPAAARLHARTDAALPMTFVRSTAYWQHLFPRFRTARTLREGGGKLVAAWHGEVADGVYVVRQVVSQPKAPVMSSLLAHCARAAKRAGVEKLRFHLSLDHPFARHCPEYGAEASVRYPRNSGCMLRVLSFRSFARKLLPELSARVVAASLEKPLPSLTLATDLGQLGLGFDGDTTLLEDSPASISSRVRVDQGRLCQLLSGYRSIDDLSGLPGVTAPTAALPLLRVLFPQRCPYLWQADRF